MFIVTDDKRFLYPADNLQISSKKNEFLGSKNVTQEASRECETALLIIWIIQMPKSLAPVTRSFYMYKEVIKHKCFYYNFLSNHQRLINMRLIKLIVFAYIMPAATQRQKRVSKR